MKSHAEHLTVKWHDIDLHRRLRPSSFMNIAQELANLHARELKFGYEELIAMHQVWVLSRFKARFPDLPQWQDDIRAETWHKGKQGLFGLRDFAVYDTQGRERVAATSSWVIINTQTRRIERNNPFNLSEEAQSMALNRDAIGQPCDKIGAPQTAEPAGSHEVSYSDVDFNLHANNARYVEWIMDSFPAEFIRGHLIREFQINYITEAKSGDTVALYRREIPTPEEIRAENRLDEEARTFYVEGRRNEELVFQSLFTFGKI